MLKILHKGIQANLDVDNSTFTGVLEDDLQLAYVTGMVAGKLVGLDAEGKGQLADGTGTPLIVGFLINDLGGYFFENKPGMASLKLSVTLGNCVVKTDQTAVACTAGDALYADNAGLVTNISNGARIGIAGSNCIAGGELLIYV